jgi:hypothetical protein
MSSWPGQNQEIHDRIDNDFSFHPASTEERRDEHTSVRVRCKDLAHWIADKVPPGRELALALTALEETMHWANAGIAKQD